MLQFVFLNRTGHRGDVWLQALRTSALNDKGEDWSTDALDISGLRHSRRRFILLDLGFAGRELDCKGRITRCSNAQEIPRKGL